MGWFYEYGWVVVYNNYFNIKEFYYKIRLFFIYLKGNMVLFIGVFRNNFG